MSRYLRQSTASQTRTIGPFVDSGDFTTLKNGLTIANTDVVIKKAGAASGTKNSGGATADGSGGLYHLTWDATDTATVGELYYSVKVAGALVVFGTYTVLEEAVYDALFASSAPGYVANAPVNVAQISGSSTAADNAEIVFATDFATNYSTTTDKWQVEANVLQIEGSDATNQIRDAVVDDSTRIDASALNTLSSHDPGETIMGATDLGTGAGLTSLASQSSVDTIDSIVDTINSATDTLVQRMQGLVNYQDVLGGTGNDTTHLNLTLPSGVGNDTIVGRVVVVYDATDGTYHTRYITAWDNTSDLATIDRALSFTPASGDTFFVLANDDGRIYSLLDTEVAAIKAKTDNLPSDPADASDIASAFSAVNTKLDTIDDLVDTEVAAIKAVTDKLDDTLEDDGGTYRFTTNALEQAPGGSSNPFTVASGTIGSTGNTTTTLHLTGLTQGDDELNDLLIVVRDVSTGEYHSRWVLDWVLSTELATVALLPFTPQNATDTYVVLGVRQDVTGGSGLDAAGVRAAIGLASANLDTQLGTIDTNVDAILVDTGTTLQNELDEIQADTEDIQSRLPASLVSGRMDSSVGAMAANTFTASALATDAVTEIQSGLATAAALATVDSIVDDILVDTSTTLQNALDGIQADTEDIQSRIGTPSNLGSGASLAANLVDVESQTDDIGTAGAGLTAVPWNTSWDAEVQSEVQDALEANNLDHLVKAAVDTDFATTVHLDSVVGQLADNGTTATFSRTTDSLEAIRDRGDGAWVTATGFSTLSQADVRSAVGLASANLDTQLTAIDDYLDTEVAAIKAKTDNLPSDPADASDIASSFTTVNSKLDTIDDFLDTEIAAIKAKTDNLPADPANASDIAASFTTVNNKLDAIDDYVDTEVSAIKAKTDLLPASPASSSEVAALLTTQLSESYNADGAAPTVSQALFAIMQRLTEFSISGTTITVKRLDGSTTAFTLTMNDASAPTSSTRSS